MSTRMKWVSGAVGLLLAVTIVGCSVSSGTVPGGGQYVRFTILGKSFTFLFGDAGVIEVEPNRMIKRVAALQLFNETPPETPPSGQMRLLNANVGVAQVLAKRRTVAAVIPQDGTATIRFSIASGTSADLCDSATLLAEYTLNVTTGVASLAQEVYELSREALDVIVTNNVTVCIEVTADFSGTITLQQFSLTFGGGSGAVNATFNLRNQDSENIHLMLPDDPFDESTEINPGGSRTRRLTGVEAGDTISVRAGRGGVVLDTTDCPEVTGADYEATVAWNGTSVTCTADQSGGGPAPGGTREVPINSAGEEVSRTAEYGGIDYAVVGVMDGTTPDAPAPQQPGPVNVDLSALGLQYVERIYMGTGAAWVPDLPNGQLVAALSCAYAEGGTPTTLEFRLGSNTAEWSYERPEHDTMFGGVAHTMPNVLYSNDTNIDSAYTYTGHIYASNLDLDTSRTLSRLTLTAVDPAQLGTRHPAAAEPTWAGLAITCLTLVGPAGTPGGGGGGGGGGTGGTGTVAGQVVDALAGTPISGATVAISGTSLTTTTGTDGRYSLANAPEGAQTVVTTATGYVENSTAVVILANASTDSQIGLVPVGAAGDKIVIVLAWGTTPYDLDLHLSGPDGAGGRFHAYYSNKNPVPYAFLDLDDRDGSGPETMTIRPQDDGTFVAGDYHVWVHNYSGSPEFDASGARITLTAGGAQLAQYDVGVATGSPADDIWQIVNLTVGEDGSVTGVSVVQAFASGSAGSVF